MPLAEEFLQIEKTAREELHEAAGLDQVETLRIKYLGRKGRLAEATARLGGIDPEERRLAGREANRVKEELERLFDDRKRSFEASPRARERGEAADLTLPGVVPRQGHLHVLTRVIDEISDIFMGLGFEVASGPEIETEFHNFEALNIPPDHPSRDSFDTFYLENQKLLRSQTSTVQIRVMEKKRPPIKVIAPGRVYRPDATDASHSFMFHQIEGLLVDEKVSFAELKGVLLNFARRFFGANVTFRFRPHFFPFTEPSAEMDILWSRGGKDSWLEILGAGMVHPHVLSSVKLSPEKFTGFAFGLGVERIAMLRWGIPDIRMFFDNDVRFLAQFG